MIFDVQGKEKQKQKAGRKMSPTQREGLRSLRSIISSVYLQQVMDALVPVPLRTARRRISIAGRSRPRPGWGAAAPPKEQHHERCGVPGFRADIAAPYLGAEGPGPSFLGTLRWTLVIL